MGLIPVSGRSTGGGNSNPSMDRKNPWAKNLKMISTEVYEFTKLDPEAQRRARRSFGVWTISFLLCRIGWSVIVLVDRNHIWVQVVQWVKNPPANSGDVGLIPGSGRSPGRRSGSPLQYSFLENPMDMGAWRGIVHGTAKCRIQLSANTQVILAVSWQTFLILMFEGKGVI